MRKTLISITVIVLVTPAFAQIGAKIQQGDKITGIWQNTQFGYQMTLMLNENGTGEFDGESITYKAQAGKMQITQAGQTTSYSYSLQANSLTLSGGDLDAAITLTRSGSNQNTNGNQVVNQGTVTQPTTGSSTNAALIGVWTGHGETIEFKSNGQCIYLGNAFQYQVSSGHITLITAQGNALIAYSVNGNQLNMTVNGQNFTYMKDGATGANTSGANAISSSGKVAMELVGKWCWTNVNSTNSGGSSSSTCIVLNANGAYEYASERSMDTNTNAFWAGTSSQSNDAGIWWVEGDRIFYNSRTRGQGSYLLQKMNHPKTGDPMIVLDGEAYVTFFQKQPW
jgi:hypothetical protein